MNYDKALDELIGTFTTRPTLLLHACCAPCSSSVIERLAPYFNITVLFYNPNIEPFEEYETRKEELIRLLDIMKIKYINAIYDNDEWHECIKGLEEEKERGKRCYACYQKRLEYTAKTAKKYNYDYFGTTLTLSPFKVAEWINEIGYDLEKKYKVNYMPSDFKKQNGYKRSIELSNQYGLYRQNYCGCIYSKENRYNSLNSSKP